ncbi:PREDICTED: serine protease snake-like [Papilio xuthus]|uniref:Serine protease snake-like n=1 Tax=Papilio xuthus TaxID=66420 RepID=A0AAJ6Z5S6_PAPXU|nr:PREDICTED: serine protease snake-like [Papilio xuthus]
MTREIPVVFLFLYLFAPTNGQFEGDICMKNGARGTCMVLDKCQSAVNDIRHRISPQICSFKGMDPIVCCSDVAPASTAAPPVLTTSTKKPKVTTEYVPPSYDYVFNDPSLGGDGECEAISANLTSPRTGQKAWDKCLEYQEKLVYPCVKSNSLSGEKARTYRCNHRTDQLVVGGVNAADKEFPHMALLGFGNVNSIQWQCGGSVISERFILTAGHCTSSREFGPVTYALVGILSRTEHVDASQRYKIKNIIKHPEYKAPKRYNDIALLETETEMTLSDKVVPACLHVDTTAQDEKALASGWGATQNRGSSADVLQKVILNKFSELECAMLFPPTRLMSNGFNGNTQICYGDKEKSKDTCQGDSGGPLQLKNTKIHCMYTVIGVTSFGRACGFVGEPGIYTKVSAYVPWIESIIWP